MSSVMNVIPDGPGSVSPRMKHRWTRVRGRAGPSSTQWPGFSAVPWTVGSGFESLGPIYATSKPRTSRYHSIAFRGSETTIAIVSTPRTVIRIETESEIRGMNLRVALPRASAFCGPTPVHLRVPLQALVVRDPLDPPPDPELCVRLPCLPRVVLASGVRGERLGGRHPEAADDPPQHFAAGVIPANLQVRDRTITVVRIPRHMEAFVQLTERRRRCGAAQVREDQQPLAGNRSLLPDDPEGGLHVLREAGGLGAFVQAEIFFRAVRPVLGDREAFGEKPAAVKPFQRAKLLHPEAGGEIGTQTPEGLCRGDWIGEAGVQGDPLLRQGEGEEIFRVEVPGHDRTVREEIGEADEARPKPVGEIFHLGHVLRLKSRDPEDIDPAHRVERHHAGEGRDGLVQQLRGGEIQLADLDATAHLPDFRHADELAVLDEGEEPAFPVPARDLGPEGLRPRIEERQDPHRIRARLARERSEGGEILREDVHLRLRLPRHENSRDDSVLLEAVHKPFELVPFEPRPLSNARERYGTVRREEASHDRLDRVRYLRMGRIVRDVQIASGPSIPLEAADHIDIVVELVQGLLHLLPLRANLRVDRPDVHPVPFLDHLEDLLLEVGERAPGERGEEERHIFRTDVPNAAVQETALEDVAGLPPPEPLLVVEIGRVIVDVEDHAGFEA